MTNHRDAKVTVERPRWRVIRRYGRSYAINPDRIHVFASTDHAAAISELGHTHASLARRYGIARQTVTKIVARRVYKGIAPAPLDEARRLLEMAA